MVVVEDEPHVRNNDMIWTKEKKYHQIVHAQKMQKQSTQKKASVHFQMNSTQNKKQKVKRQATPIALLDLELRGESRSQHVSTLALASILYKYYKK